MKTARLIRRSTAHRQARLRAALADGIENTNRLRIRRAASLCNRASPPRVPRSGFTIIEVLVCIGVVGILVAILLPAVQASRSRARRVACVNNLKQLGVAVHTFETAFRGFPETTMHSFVNRVLRSGISAQARLVPYVLGDSESLKQMDFDDMTPNKPGIPPRSSSARNEPFLSLRVPTFLCPEESHDGAGNSYRTCMGSGPGWLGPKTGATCVDPGNGTGAFVNGRSVKPTEIRDGLSNTVLFSERLLADGQAGAYTPWRDIHFPNSTICTVAEARSVCAVVFSDLPPHDSYAGWTWLYGGWNHTWYSHVLPPNSAIPDCNPGGIIVAGGAPGAYSARALHPGGVNVVMADGSTRFIDETIDLSVWQAMATRDSGELSQ